MMASASRWRPEWDLSFSLAMGRIDQPSALVDPGLPIVLAGPPRESSGSETVVEHYQLGDDSGRARVVVARFADDRLLERVEEPVEGERLPEVSLRSPEDLCWVGVYAAGSESA